MHATAQEEIAAHFHRQEPLEYPPWCTAFDGKGVPAGVIKE
jgi:hypothetical protein